MAKQSCCLFTMAPVQEVKDYKYHDTLGYLVAIHIIFIEKQSSMESTERPLEMGLMNILCTDWSRPPYPLCFRPRSPSGWVRGRPTLQGSAVCCAGGRGRTPRTRSPAPRRPPPRPPPAARRWPCPCGCVPSAGAPWRRRSGTPPPSLRWG